MENKGLADVLNRLDRTLNRKKGGTSNAGGTGNGPNLKELRAKHILSLKNGKNSVAVLIPKGKTDPFVEWGYHEGLQEVSFHSIPCVKHNDGKECLACQAVDLLRKQNFKGNYAIWSPIEQKIETYVPVINLESDATIAEGAKWLKVPKSAMFQMFEWLRNVEADEKPFYDLEEPQKVIINYAKEEIPAKKYSLDKKNMKALNPDQVAEWIDALPDIRTLIYPKSEEQTKKIVDEYFERLENQVTDNSNVATEAAPDEVPEEVSVRAESRLGSLKTGKKSA